MFFISFLMCSSHVLHQIFMCSSHVLHLFFMCLHMIFINFLCVLYMFFMCFSHVLHLFFKCILLTSQPYWMLCDVGFMFFIDSPRRYRCRNTHVGRFAQEEPLRAIASGKGDTKPATFKVHTIAFVQLCTGSGRGNRWYCRGRTLHEVVVRSGGGQTICNNIGEIASWHAQTLPHQSPSTFG